MYNDQSKNKPMDKKVQVMTGGRECLPRISETTDNLCLMTIASQTHLGIY